jgi:hypothetical protein
MMDVSIDNEGIYSGMDMGFDVKILFLFFLLFLQDYAMHNYLIK